MEEPVWKDPSEGWNTEGDPLFPDPEECLVCAERTAALLPARRCPRQPECRGNVGICAQCEQKLDACVICRSPMNRDARRGCSISPDYFDLQAALRVAFMTIRVAVMAASEVMAEGV